MEQAGPTKSMVYVKAGPAAKAGPVAKAGPSRHFGGGGQLTPLTPPGCAPVSVKKLEKYFYCHTLVISLEVCIERKCLF